MLTFYRGSQLEPLAGELTGLLRSEPLGDPLAPETVIVQNHGMARWLSARIARDNGIAANLEYPFPAEKVWDFYRVMDESIPEQLPSDRGPMTWTIYGLLEELPRRSPYLSVWHYMRGDDGAWNPLKAWKLAGRIGDLFDRYLNYRPRLLLDWEKGERHGYGAVEAWQAGLWNRLNAVWKRDDPDMEWRHRAGIHEAFMERLRSGALPESGLPQRITLFGLSGLPPATLELYANLSKYLDLRWFWMDPAAGNAEHPLVQSWGGEGGEFRQLFREVVERDGIPLEEQRVNGTSRTGIRLPSSAIQIHSCHSALREVEVLHNTLLDLFNHNEELGPDDVLVVAPDIDTYAPFIEAVFGATEKGLPDLPFHVVDDHTGIRNEVYTAFGRLLRLLDSRFKVTEVLDLLSGRVVRDRFEIDEDELDRLHHWIERARVRWGISGDDKEAMELPGSPQFTWLGGLDRLMLGFAAQFEDELYRDIYPLGGVESSDDAELLGRFSRLLENLREVREQVRTPRHPAGWARVLSVWIEAFIPSGADYHRPFRGLNKLVSDLEEEAGLGTYDRKLGFPVVLDYIENRLDAEAGRGGYFGHGITFSGPDQMRNIPFEVIGMIGMNNEAFPRSKVTPEFDLIARDPKPGDRLNRNDDRYLFLETLQSAGSACCICYTGQSNRDDSTRPPSVLVSELLDHVETSEGAQTDGQVVRHPLHGFSRRYFNREHPELYSYSPSMHEVSRRAGRADEQSQLFLPGDDRLPDAGEAYRNVTVDELVRFFGQPSRYLLQQRLGIDLRDRAVVNEDRESFELRGLDGFLLGDRMVQRMLGDKDIEDFESVARATGILPEGWPGRQAFREKAAEVTEFATLVKNRVNQPQSVKEEVSLDLGDFHLTGILNSIYEEYQLSYRLGRLRAKDLLDLWVRHLVLQELPNHDLTRRSLMITREKNGPEEHLLPELQGSRELLCELLELYWHGIHAKLPLFPETSLAFARERVIKGGEEEKALNKARGEWLNPWRPGGGEAGDPYVKLLFNREDPIGSPTFKNLALRLWEPLLKALDRGEGTHV